MQDDVDQQAADGGADELSEDAERAERASSIPVIVPDVYVEAHRIDSEPPEPLETDRLERTSAALAAAPLPKAPPVPSELRVAHAAGAARPPPLPPQISVPRPPSAGAAPDIDGDGRPTEPAPAPFAVELVRPPAAFAEPPPIPESATAPAAAGAPPVNSIGPTEVASGELPAPESPARSRAVPLALVGLALAAAAALLLYQDTRPPAEVSMPEPVAAVKPGPVEATPAPETAPSEAPQPVPIKVVREPSVTDTPQPKVKKRQGRRNRRTAVGPATLPAAPSRTAIVRAMRSVQSEVRRCGAGRRGIAQVDLTLNPAGTVKHAVVGGDFGGTPQGSCIARAVRRAKVAPFRRESFRILYPFKL